MNDDALRGLAYIGTGAIALDRIRAAFKSGKPIDYAIAGGIVAGLALEVRRDREFKQMQLSATITPKVAGTGSLAGIGTSVAGATASNPSVWRQIGMTALDVAKGVGTVALGQWAASELSDSGGGGQTIVLQGQGGPNDPRNNPQAGAFGSGIDTKTVLIVAGAGLAGIVVLAVMLRR
jgi:hypothetical protein